VQQGRNDNRIKTILSIAKNSGVSLQAITNDKLKEKCPKARHQGVVAQIRRSQSSAVSLDDILEKESVLLLVLDEVQDPHNIGACLRTADAIGVDAVIVSKNRSPALTPVIRNVARVSIPMQGSVESLNISVATAVCLYEVRRQLNE